VALLREHRAGQLQHRLTLGPTWQKLDLVFPNPWGGPRNGSNVTHQFAAKLKKAGLPHMTYHQLRHGTATLLLAQGVDLRTIQEILGHTTIAVTATYYAHVAPKLKGDAADHMDTLFGGQAAGAG
jgi:integrase